jgi:hypothetical protein
MLQFQQQLSSRLTASLKLASKETDSFHDGLRAYAAANPAGTTSARAVVEPPKFRYGSNSHYYAASSQAGYESKSESGFGSASHYSLLGRQKSRGGGGGGGGGGATNYTASGRGGVHPSDLYGGVGSRSGAGAGITRSLHSQGGMQQRGGSVSNTSTYYSKR